jgi:uncharacterized membrane protein
LAVQALSFAVPLIVLGVVLYLPFYLSFTSQADGIGAVVSNPAITIPATKPLHLLIFWGPMFALALPLVGARLLAARGRITRRMMAISAAPTVLVILGWAVVFLFEKARGSANLGGGHAGLFTQIGDRSNGWITALFLGALLAAALTALWCEITARRGESGEADGEREPLIFVLGLISTALLLVLGTEFFFVGDVFHSRMNTVFKLYYQAWMALAIAGGFALYYLVSRWRVTFSSERTYRIAWGGSAAVVLAGAVLYPLGGAFNRMRPYDANGNRSSATGELRGLAYYSADERAGIDYLAER